MASARITSRRVERLEGKPPQQYQPGRVCRDCGAKLSRYNPSPYCFTHQPGVVYPVLRGRRTY